MYSIRRASPEELRLTGAPSIDDELQGLLRAGTSRPEWCFVLAREGVDVGRVGLRVEPTCQPELLGLLPEREVHLFGLWLPWDEPDHLAAGRFLVERAVQSVRPEIRELPQVVVNDSLDRRVAEQLRFFESLGMSLFQEKQGYGWTREDTPLTAPLRLSCRTYDEVGHEVYRRTLGRVGEATLDRNDAWYRALAGEDNWASVFMTFLGPSDASGWLHCSNERGEAVGIVAVSPFDSETATIVFIGVVPEQRGHGYIDDLVRAGTAAALRAGFTSMLSDADVVNVPMTAAFVRNGHRADARPWHKWHYRF